MKFLRFIKKLVTSVLNFIWVIIYALIVLGVLAGIAWIIGYIALVAGMPIPPNYNGNHELAAGITVVMLSGLFGLFISGIFQFGEWIWELWEDS